MCIRDSTASEALAVSISEKACVDMAYMEPVSYTHLESGRQVSMGESVFEVVTQSVTAREAAELYGIAVGRGGMARCPFHDDRHPSMKVDTRFHFVGCGADGDVIDFTARLYDLSPKGCLLYTSFSEPLPPFAPA